jgi:predicted homoserine dehydrogenase-like protein
MSKLTRRSFGKTAALAGVTTALGASQVLGAGNRVRLGFIGLGNRGDQVLDAFLEHKDCEVTAICDIIRKVTRRRYGRPVAMVEREIAEAVAG